MSRGLTLEQIEFLVGKGLSAEEMLAFAKMGNSRSKAAERTARWRAKRAGNVTSDVTGDGHGDASQPPNEYISNPTVSDETVLAAPAKSSSKRGTRLADDFEPPEDWIEWAMRKRGWSRTEATDEAECFTRHWQAKPGRDACKLDWPKTWQNWVVNSRRQTPAPSRRGGDPPSFMDHVREKQRLQASG